MGHMFVAESAYSTVINAEATVYSSWFDVSRCSKVAFLISVTKTSSPGNLTLTLEGTADSGTTAITLDFQDGAGLGASEAYGATGDDFIWLPAGSTVPAIRLTLDAAATTDSSNYWTPKIFIVGFES